MSEHASTVDGPLAGVRVLDLSIAATGPYAATLLADQGAEVIKVERPGFGDIGRYVGVAVGGVSALFHSCNRGKRSVAVDPHTDDGRAIVLELAHSVDVFVQNFRPGVMSVSPRISISWSSRIDRRSASVRSATL